MKENDANVIPISLKEFERIFKYLPSQYRYMDTSGDCTRQVVSIVTSEGIKIKFMVYEYVIINSIDDCDFISLSTDGRSWTDIDGWQRPLPSSGLVPTKNMIGKLIGLTEN